MKRIFMQELKAYLADHAEHSVAEKLPIRIDKRFPGNVQPGEIRLFADVYPPRSGLFHKRLPDGDWLVIPLSEPSFTVPASNQEALIGDKIYQFWNELRLPDFNAKRSYLEGRITEEDSKIVGMVLRHLHLGDTMPPGLPVAFGEPITRKNDKRVVYFKKFLLSETDFTLNLIWRIPDIPKKVIDELPERKAAADGTDSPVFVVCRKGDPDKQGMYSDDYGECRLALPFSSFGAGLKPKKLKFKEVGDFPENWNVVDGAFVSIHERATRKQIGSGHLDLAKQEILIDDFTGLEALDAPVKSTADLVLVVVSPKNG